MKFLAAALALILASPAWADEVLLRNGHKVVGIQTEEKDRIIVETGYGTVSFPREEVVSVTKGDTLLHAWPGRFAEIEKSTNASDFTKLAAWARESGMPRYVNSLMRRALELDPENADARAALGYVKHEGKWLTVAEHRKAQGDVQEGGKWVNALEKALAERRKLELESRKLDREVERRRREDRRRRAQEQAALQARMEAMQSAPTAFDPPTWGRRGRWGWGLGECGDLWVLSLFNGVFFTGPFGVPRAPAGPPTGGGAPEFGPVSPTFP
ncbi:MAG TPA: hypothetical protein VFS19_05750 [Planctomycetota bacterium]|nr:hypothetical protein [Planctomycetota bacterium]